jgi:hypothetical protein
MVCTWVLDATISGFIAFAPQLPSTSRFQSRPADRNRSYIPKTTDAWEFGSARMATVGGADETVMAEMSGWRPK